MEREHSHGRRGHEGHMHDEGYGEHHAHGHDEACGCGKHHHVHGHDEACGCGGQHREPDYDNGLTIGENNVLMALTERGALPVARFALTSSKNAEAYAVAMEPVYIASPSDSMDVIREYGALFAGMEDKGLIDLDYDVPLPGYPYFEYKGSDAWKRFVEAAAEAKARGFTFDTPNLELGGIALTSLGHEVIDRMLG